MDLWACANRLSTGTATTKDDRARSLQIACKAAQILTAEPDPKPPVLEPSDDAMDAARYRWLRDRGDACQWGNILRFDLEEFVCADNALDAAIDAAMAGGGV